MLFALAGALALRAVWRRCRERKAPDAALLLVLVTLAVLALTLLTNLLVPTLLPDRTRYAIGLWPLFCLLIGLGLVRADLAKSSPPPPPRLRVYSLLLALLLLTGLMGNWRSSLRGRYIFTLPVPPFHHAMRELQPRWRGEDRLVVDDETLPQYRTYRYYTSRLGDKRRVLATMSAEDCDADCLAAYADEMSAHDRLWLMFVNPAGDLQGRLRQALGDGGYAQCLRRDYDASPPLTLMLLARDASECA